MTCINIFYCTLLSGENYFGVHIYPVERHCAMVGGLCVQKGDCAEPTTKKGLCGKSQHLNVECCYSSRSQYDIVLKCTRLIKNMHI